MDVFTANWAATSLTLRVGLLMYVLKVRIKDTYFKF